MTRLPPAMLNEFYAQKLIVPKPIIFEGEMQSKVLIITDYSPAKPSSTPTEITFLDKILSACKLQREACIVVNNSFQKCAYQVLINRFEADYVVFFTGTLIYDYGFSLDFKFYEPFESKGVKMVVSDTLDRLLLTTPQIINAKKKLWTALCATFQINMEPKF